ncbi:SgcJ/EcaC family oxidoreductase [Kitasatospora camelliae]|uniref:SgcJ/EcaC family oxidoreductase n=1 Tax=Kitasatospora camelliae TaxID=3156397 RepID=A0AAU8K7Z4_9ACTN
MFDAAASSKKLSWEGTGRGGCRRVRLARRHLGRAHPRRNRLCPDLHHLPGHPLQGRRDTTEAHRALFHDFLKDTALADSYLGVRFHGPDTAVVTGRGDSYTGTPRNPAELTKTQSSTLVRQEDRQWRIAAFHNTRRQNVMERISFLYDPATRPETEK